MEFAEAEAARMGLAKLRLYTNPRRTLCDRRGATASLAQSFLASWQAGCRFGGGHFVAGVRGRPRAGRGGKREWSVMARYMLGVYYDDRRFPAASAVGEL